MKMAESARGLQSNSRNVSPSLPQVQINSRLPDSIHSRNQPLTVEDRIQMGKNFSQSNIKSGAGKSPLNLQPD